MSESDVSYQLGAVRLRASSKGGASSAGSSAPGSGPPSGLTSSNSNVNAHSRTEALVAAAAAAVSAAAGARTPRSPFDPRMESALGLDLQDIKDPVRELKRLQKLGQGASGTVEKHQHLRTGKIVALKIIPAGDISEPQRKAIFLELRTFAKCRSPHIVQFYGAFMHDNKIHIGLEFMGAGALSDILNVRTIVPEPNLATLSWQVLDGLEYLHTDMKVIHRDIKPSNLVLSESGVVKITDFGVSGELSDEMAQSAKQTWVGTIHYMSPERVVGKPYKYDSDMWSLGLTLVECLTGCFPYTNEDKDAVSKKSFSVWELMKKIDQEEPPSLSASGGHSQQAIAFVAGMLQKEPKQRPSAAATKAHPWLEDATSDTRQIRLAEWVAGARSEAQDSDKPAPQLTPVAELDVAAALMGTPVRGDNPFKLTIGVDEAAAAQPSGAALIGIVRRGEENPFLRAAAGAGGGGSNGTSAAESGGPSMGESLRGGGYPFAGAAAIDQRSPSMDGSLRGGANPFAGLGSSASPPSR